MSARVGSARVIARGALSARGGGALATLGVPAGSPARSEIRHDPELRAAGLSRPLAARVPGGACEADALADRAIVYLSSALGQVVEELDRVRPLWRAERVGVALGTSSGGMRSAERFFRARASGDAETVRDVAGSATYFAPMRHALAAYDLLSCARKTQILAACAASTIAIGVGLRWLDLGACDLVLAGGYDALSVFVASGFEALRATTASCMRPFRAGRDGMALGEGAGVVALTRSGGTGPSHFWIAGFGASTDAVHVTAPDRTGAGLARAAQAALADAGVCGAAVDLVSAHGTATPFNDAMEAKAIGAACGGQRPIVHPFKAEIGHTLGAAGVLETLALSDALRSGIAPPACGEGPIDPEAEVRLLDRAEPRDLEVGLKLSAAFGGANAALVVTRSPRERPARPERAVYLRAWARARDVELPALAAATGVSLDRLARLDGLCRLGLAAVAALAADLGPGALRGAGIVAGHGFATLDTNDRFDARRREKGARAVEPRVFPATSPNAVAGECAIVYGMTGPSFAVGASLDGGVEALARASELIAAGDADHVVVVAADEAGPASVALAEHLGVRPGALRRGAIALLLRADPSDALRAVPMDALPGQSGPGGDRAAEVGHAALLRWVEGDARPSR